MEAGLTEQTPGAEKVCYLEQVCPSKLNSKGSVCFLFSLLQSDDLVMAPEIEDTTA